jgi:hypothetical protein
VVAIELPSRTQSGEYLNMRGARIDGFNGTLDALLLAANNRGTFTAGIGDGGNEAGLKGVEGIPRGRYEGREFDFAASVRSDLPVTAWNSNFGAIATAMEMARRAPDAELGGRAMPTVQDVRRSVDGAVSARAVDGVTRKNEASVDGFSMDVHEVFTTLYRERLESADSMTTRATPRTFS